MRFFMCCFVALLSLPLLAQQKGDTPNATKASAPTLTAEGYRDLIVNVADSVNTLQDPVGFGSGIARIPDPLTNREKIWFKFDTAKAKSAAEKIAEHQKTWASRRVPGPLQASHKEILEWIESTRKRLETAPAMAEGGSLELALFLAGSSSRYEKIRASTTTALAELGVTLPPIEKPKEEKK